MDFKVDYKLEGEWSRTFATLMTSFCWPLGHFGGRTIHELVAYLRDRHNTGQTEHVESFNLLSAAIWLCGRLKYSATPDAIQTGQFHQVWPLAV